MCNTRCIVQRHTRSRGRRSGVDIDPGSVRRAREEAGLSLAEVAGSELTRQAVHLIETGRMRPSTRTLEVIARRLGRPASDFRAGGSWLVSTEARLDALDRLCAEHRYDEMLRRAEDLLARESGKRMRALALFYGLNRFSGAGGWRSWLRTSPIPGWRPRRWTGRRSPGSTPATWTSCRWRRRRCGGTKRCSPAPPRSRRKCWSTWRRACSGAGTSTARE